MSAPVIAVAVPVIVSIIVLHLDHFCLLIIFVVMNRILLQNLELHRLRLEEELEREKNIICKIDGVLNHHAEEMMH